MAAPAYVSTGTKTTGSGTSAAPALPTAPSAGDLLIVVIARNNNGARGADPAGWNHISTVSNGTQITISRYWRIYQAGASAATFSWTGSTAYQAVVHRFSGADQTSPIGAIGTAFADTDNVAASNALTTTRADSLVLLTCAVKANNDADQPSGWSVAYASDAANNPALSSYTKAVAKSGASSGATSAACGFAQFITQQIEIRSPEPDAVYIGAAGQAAVYLGAEPVSQKYLGARSLF